MKSATAADRIGETTGGQKLQKLQGFKAAPNSRVSLGALPSSNAAKPGKIDPQLQQAEKNDTKIAGESGKKPQSVRVSDHTPTVAPRNMKIDFRSRPQKKAGTPNRENNGSGSKKVGAGRRITENTR